MHRAPAVNFSVQRSRWHARFIIALFVLALAACVLFAVERAALDASTAGFALAVLVATAFAFSAWHNSPQGSLRWDGQQWYWSGFATNLPCRLTLLMDFQRVVVVRLVAEDHAPLCLWLEASVGDASWRPLRRAIVSSQANVGTPGRKAEPGTAGDLA